MFAAEKGAPAVFHPPEGIPPAAPEIEQPASSLLRLPAGCYADQPRIKVSETIARKTGLFYDSYLINIQVPGKSLNHFAKLIPVPDVDLETGEIKSVKWRYEVDEQAILEAWLAAGHPLEWDPLSA